MQLYSAMSWRHAVCYEAALRYVPHFEDSRQARGWAGKLGLTRILPSFQRLVRPSEPQHCRGGAEWGQG